MERIIFSNKRSFGIPLAMSALLSTKISAQPEISDRSSIMKMSLFLDNSKANARINVVFPLNGAPIINVLSKLFIMEKKSFFNDMLWGILIHSDVIHE